MAWGKGQSGNPGGRPKDKDWAEALRIAGNVIDPETKKRRLRALAEKVYQLALSGDMEAVKEIANRRDGKASSETNVNVNLGFTQRFVDALRSAKDHAALPSPTTGSGAILDLVPEKVENS